MNQISDISKVLSNPQSNSTSKDVSIENAKLFQEKLASFLSASKSNSSSDTVNQVESLFGQDNSINNEASFFCYNQSEKLLDLLEEFSSNLLDSDKNLRSFEPLLKEIKENTQGLQDALKNLDPNDENLKNIAKECIMLANTESLKFDRGDYI